MLGGTNIIQVGPERYLGRYTNATLAHASWTTLTSASFTSVIDETALTDNLQFLMLQLFNLGTSPFYVYRSNPGGGTPAVANTFYVPPGTASGPSKTLLQVAAVLPTSTPSSPTGIRALALRGDPDTSTLGNVIVQATFAGSYGP